LSSEATAKMNSKGNGLRIKFAQGALLFDYSGQSYTDYCLADGSLIYGHSHRNVVVAAKKTAERGIDFGIPTSASADLAKHIRGAFPSMEVIQFTSSANWAHESAVNLARHFTRRDIVIKFAGCSADGSREVVPNFKQYTLSLPFNDCAALEETFTHHKDEIAGVVVEPVSDKMGVVSADQDFLQCLRRLTKRNKSILIFDETTSGFRFCCGGLQSSLGISADLTCLGKIIGGGFPLGVYGGRNDIMQQSTVTEPYNNPVILRTSLANLRLLNENFFAVLNKRALGFFSQMNNFFSEHAIPARFSFYNSMGSLRFTDQEIFNNTQALDTANPGLYRKLWEFLLKQGIYWPTAELDAMFISGMHRPRDLLVLTKVLKQFFMEKLEK
jgi:glutamate-1-semialdehyde 2,1-aminomutase